MPFSSGLDLLFKNSSLYHSSLCIQFCLHLHAGLPETPKLQKSYEYSCFSGKLRFSKNFKISQQGFQFQFGAGCLKFLIGKFNPEFVNSTE